MLRREKLEFNENKREAPARSGRLDRYGNSIFCTSPGLPGQIFSLARSQNPLAPGVGLADFYTPAR